MEDEARRPRFANSRRVSPGLRLEEAPRFVEQQGTQAGFYSHVNVPGDAILSFKCCF